MAPDIIHSDLSYYIPVDSCNTHKRRKVSPDERHELRRRQPNTFTHPSTTGSMATTEELAQLWLLVCDDPPDTSDLMTSMVHLKRRLLFSIDVFVNELGLPAMDSPSRLSSLLLAYHTWSQHGQGRIMPLISVMLPLVLHDTPSTTSSPPGIGGPVTNCFRNLNNTKVSQDYLEAILSYQVTANSLQKSTIQHWLSKLFEQDRIAIGNFLTSDAVLSPLDLYLDYFALLNDIRRLNSLSWEDKKAMVVREWTAWTPFLENQGGIEPWLSLKAEALQNQDRLDLEIDLLLQKNTMWLSKVEDNKGPVPSSSVMIDYLMDQYLEQKVPNMRMMYGIFGKHCKMMVETGQDSTEIVKILDQVCQLLLRHLQGSTNIIALLLSMVQVALNHMHSILAYPDWFKATFIDPSTTLLKSKRQQNLWIKHMETMIPYETAAILQIHAKLLNDARHFQVAAYISSVKSKLLALGVDASLRQYPPHLGTPLISDLLREPPHHHTNNTIKGHQPADMKKLIDKYGETQTIPQSLWEDSIFRPKWFKQTFLPALMIDWTPTDALTLERRAKMVLAFQQKGKIPPPLWARFQKKDAS